MQSALESSSIEQDAPSTTLEARSNHGVVTADNLQVIRNDKNLDFIVTTHARSRMYQRSMSGQVVAAVLTYGRCLHARGATIYAIGNKEVTSYLRFGIDLKDLAGYQVVCSPDDVILTVYRNHDFRSIRKTRRKRSAYNRSSFRRVAGASC